MDIDRGTLYHFIYLSCFQIAHDFSPTGYRTYVLLTSPYAVMVRLTYLLRRGGYPMDELKLAITFWKFYLETCTNDEAPLMRAHVKLTIDFLEMLKDLKGG